MLFFTFLILFKWKTNGNVRKYKFKVRHFARIQFSKHIKTKILNWGKRNSNLIQEKHRIQIQFKINWKQKRFSSIKLSSLKKSLSPFRLLNPIRNAIFHLKTLQNSFISKRKVIEKFNNWNRYTERKTRQFKYCKCAPIYRLS